jgi:hypothetical protein
MGLKALYLEADSRLRRPEQIGGPRKAQQVGDMDERPHCIEIEDFHFGVK